MPLPGKPHEADHIALWLVGASAMGTGRLLDWLVLGVAPDHGTTPSVPPLGLHPADAADPLLDRTMEVINVTTCDRRGFEWEMVLAELRAYCGLNARQIRRLAEQAQKEAQVHNRADTDVLKRYREAITNGTMHPPKRY